MVKITRPFETKLESRLQEPLNFIQVVIGPRQVGKTTALKRIYENWMGPKLFITADSPTPYSHEWLTLHWEQAAAMGKDTLFIIDEVQKIVGWNETIKLLFDRGREARNLKVVILGSASLSIQQGLSSSLAGRVEIVKAPHWSYIECQQAFGYSFEDFIIYGGYPAAAELKDDFDRWKSFILESIIERVLGRDILGIVKIGKPALFRQTYQLAMRYPSQQVSFQKLLGQLQESGNVTTIKHYLELLESAYLLKLLYKFTSSPVATTGSSPKIVPLNNALVNCYVTNVSALKDPMWRGRLLESAVGAYLSSQPGNLFYWREGKFEVDFVHELDGKITAYEVKSGAFDKLKGLELFKKRYPKADVVIVDRERAEDLLNKAEELAKP